MIIQITKKNDYFVHLATRIALRAKDAKLLIKI